MKKSKKESENLPANDHRSLGQKLNLFSFHDISPGAPFWHHKGMIVFRELERYARKINDENGYEEISTPILVKKELFEQSGHWKHYRDNIFWFKNPRDKKELLALKPMNCPESTFIYNSAIRSYKDLPLRLAEIGRLHRNELSGTLGGMFRVRQITMDDAHIFVQPNQIEDEVGKIVKIIEKFYNGFGFTSRLVLATRPSKALGSKKDWEVAETALTNTLKKNNISFSQEKGEGAFYGPKIEVHMKDAQKRDWQLGTIQLDLVMLPKQFKLAYIDENGKKQTPWVLHRAIFGSFERFIGILLEHFNGALPFWLSPIQVAVLTVAEDAKNYTNQIVSDLQKTEYRLSFDDRNETIGKKIRGAEIQKIPYLIIVGKKEAEAKKITVRERGGRDLGQMDINAFKNLLLEAERRNLLL